MNPKRVYGSYTFIGIIVLRVYDPNFRVHFVLKVRGCWGPGCVALLSGPSSHVEGLRQRAHEATQQHPKP